MSRSARFSTILLRCCLLAWWQTPSLLQKHEEPQRAARPCQTKWCRGLRALHLKAIYAKVFPTGKRDLVLAALEPAWKGGWNMCGNVGPHSNACYKWEIVYGSYQDGQCNWRGWWSRLDIVLLGKQWIPEVLPARYHLVCPWGFRVEWWQG